MVYAGSRYEGVTPLRDEQGNPYFGRITPPSLHAEYIEYLTKEGDRMDLLADRFLGDATRWWEIADLNPEVIDFEDIEPNTRLRIPHARTT